jgi:hypothetical protein
MTQEDKNLLLQDLCGRLPYGVKMNHIADTENNPITLVGVAKTMITLESSAGYGTSDIEDYIPYLFPLSSMTEEQKIECFKGTDIELDEHNEIWSTFPISNSDIVLTNLNNWLKVINWLNKNHFDYNGLIERGLALDATGLNIY